MHLKPRVELEGFVMEGWLLKVTVQRAILGVSTKLFIFILLDKYCAIDMPTTGFFVAADVKFTF